MLVRHPWLLLISGDVTDSSGRTFKNITAYDYAYWAKKTYMRQILAKHMNEDTKAATLVRCEAIDKNGLTYRQDGIIVEHSTPLNTTYYASISMTLKEQLYDELKSEIPTFSIPAHLDKRELQIVNRFIKLGTSDPSFSSYLSIQPMAFTPGSGYHFYCTLPFFNMSVAIDVSMISRSELEKTRTQITSTIRSSLDDLGRGE